jgi:hypothetical protein
MARHDIKLVYDGVSDTLTSISKGDTIRPGDEVHFDSDMGPVRVLMLPSDKFSIPDFRTGDEPIKVEIDGSFAYCCGILLDNLRPVGYPGHRRFGGQFEVPPPPG